MQKGYMMANRNIISSERVNGIFYYVIHSFFVKRRKLLQLILLLEKTYQQLYYVHHDCFWGGDYYLGIMQQLETILRRCSLSIVAVTGYFYCNNHLLCLKKEYLISSISTVWLPLARVSEKLSYHAHLSSPRLIAQRTIFESGPTTLLMCFP